RRQRLPQLRGVRDIAALVGDDPVVGTLLERRDSLAVRFDDGHALDIAERGLEVRNQRGARAYRRRRALPEEDEREQHDEHASKDRNRPLAHVRAFLLRRRTTTPNAAIVSSTGMTSTLRTLIHLPSTSMSASRLRRTVR